MLAVSVVLVMCFVMMLPTNDACQIKKVLVWEEGKGRGFYGKTLEVKFEQVVATSRAQEGTLAFEKGRSDGPVSADDM
jgi:hypothetical protein